MKNRIKILGLMLLPVLALPAHAQDGDHPAGQPLAAARLTDSPTPQPSADDLSGSIPLATLSLVNLEPFSQELPQDISYYSVRIQVSEGGLNRAVDDWMHYKRHEDRPLYNQTEWIGQHIHAQLTTFLHVPNLQLPGSLTPKDVPRNKDQTNILGFAGGASAGLGFHSKTPYSGAFEIDFLDFGWMKYANQTVNPTQVFDGVYYMPRIKLSAVPSPILGISVLQFGWVVPLYEYAGDRKNLPGLEGFFFSVGTPELNF